MYDNLFFIGASSGLGGNQSGSEKAPFFLKNALKLKLLKKLRQISPLKLNLVKN